MLSQVRMTFEEKMLVLVGDQHIILSHPSAVFFSFFFFLNGNLLGFKKKILLFHHNGFHPSQIFFKLLSTLEGFADEWCKNNHDLLCYQFQSY